MEYQQQLSSLPAHLSERCRFISNASQNGDFKTSNLFKTIDTESPIVYWTHHALRTDENPALDVARRIASLSNRSLLVFQWISPLYRFASDRHHTFLLQAAQDLEKQYKDLGIRFALYLDRDLGDESTLRRLANLAALIVTDDFPGEPTNVWTETLQGQTATQLIHVDTSCVVPMQVVGRAYDRAFAFRDATASEYALRIPKTWPVISETPIRFDGVLPDGSISLESGSIAQIVAECPIDHGVGPVTDTIGGSEAGYARWSKFKSSMLSKYASKRNDPCAGVASRMSAYLHYGMVSPMRIAREANTVHAEKYLEELLIWRELAYCYCFYRDDYETTESLPAWALSTLKRHEEDPRSDIFSWETLARGRTNDRLWNACQRSLLKHGELHNNVRMTWGKALLQWSENSQDCLRKLIDLNHRYALDGRDPASYGGILWCLGQFDRPFQPEMPITGTVRSRSTSEHISRLNIDRYEAQVDRPSFPTQSRIAMIGAGVGGLLCARTLQDHGLDITIFEKSRGPSGRAATRRIENELHFDHGAQYFTCRDQRIAKYLESWIHDGIVQPWQGRITAWSDGHSSRVPDRIRFVGTPNMNSLGSHLANGLHVAYRTKVSKVVKEEMSYRLFAGRDDDQIQDRPERDIGLFDYVIWNCPSVQTVALLPPNCKWQREAEQTKMWPCWSVMFALESEWQVPFDGAFLNGQETLSWVARNSSKPGRPNKLDCWVLHSHRKWARANLGMPEDEVAQLLLSELSKEVPVSIPSTIFRQSRRWLYAQPETRFPDECAWDKETNLGACGDWFRNENLEGAMLSGLALAGRILGSMNEKTIQKSFLRETPGLKQLELF